MPKFILSPQHPVGFHRFSACFFIFRLSGRIQSPYLFRLNVRDLLQLRRIRFRAVLCFSRAALLICSESDTSLNNYTKRDFKCKVMFTVHTVSCTCRTASGQFSDGAGIQPVYTPFRSVLNKRRWRLGPLAGDFSIGWIPLL